MAQIASSRYSKAIFEVCIENNTLDTVIDQMQTIKQILDENNDFKSVILHPEIATSEKLDLMKKIFGASISVDVYGLFNIVFQKNREVFLTEIIDDFLDIAKEYKGIVVAKITTAIPLTEMQIIKIKDTLNKKINKQIVIESFIDESLIGGMCILVNNQLIDSSIKKQLNELDRRLLNLQFV